MRESFSQSLTKKALGFLAALITGAVFLGILGSASYLFLQPFSDAYRMELPDTAYRVHIGDAIETGLSFTPVSDSNGLLFLQGLKKNFVHYENSDGTILAVDKKGSILAVGEGQATVTACVGKSGCDIQVTVLVPADSLSFEKDSYVINCGETLTLNTLATPDNAVLFEEITTGLSDESLARLTKDGNLQALHPGTVTVSCESDGCTGEAEVQILQPMKAITLAGIAAGETITLERGESKTFSVNFFPEDTTDDRTLSYALTDNTVGTIEENGVFTATGRGLTTLVVRCGQFMDTVPVFSRVTLQEISLNHEACDLKKNETDVLVCTLIPEDTTDVAQILYASDNEEVVTVGEDGTVTAVGGGTATVTVTAGNFIKKCTYSVKVPITGVAISKTGIGLYTGDSYGLSAAVRPKDTTESDKSIVWTSDNPAVAQVNAAGGVTAIAPGTTVIRATHGNFQASCVVSVTNRPDPNVVADNIIAYGKQFLGTPYVYGGGSLTSGIDCSTFTRLCFASQGISIPSYSYTQVNAGTPVSTDPSAWRKGDLIFYSPTGRVSHVAIYIGDGLIMHSSQSQGGVVITPYNYGGLTPSHVRRYF